MTSHPPSGRNAAGGAPADVMAMSRSPELLPFGVAQIDRRLVGGGIGAAALHEVAAASISLADDAAATLFLGGMLARFAKTAGGRVLWAVTRFDLYAPALGQVGLEREQTEFALARQDEEVVSLMEEGLREGAYAAVVGEVRHVSRTATRRLMLSAASSRTPAFLLRRRRRKDACPFGDPSDATTRWRIGCMASGRSPPAATGRLQWSVEMVSQRDGEPFSVTLGACDGSGRLAASAATGGLPATGFATVSGREG
ncbi:ImuA family protein [Sphingomonas albertensis]|uniref:Protein ImuA n=1 Tax=Sphingomonas albertensis TaxID=2762591 RepID=A0ABR7AJJ6_9SPHN|nr:protein ImuA [Sphingomonas albertensis]MBC3940633.1 protein ImuA [Sphingomonas albertensis]